VTTQKAYRGQSFATIDELFIQEQLYCVTAGICPFRVCRGSIC